LDYAIKLPNFSSAVVPKRKVTRYLLNQAHPAGGSKAAFFLRFGFLVPHWKVFADLLLQHASQNAVAAKETTQYGMRYVVDGPLVAPDGTCLNIRCVWFIDNGMKSPRFVTAYSLPKS
jgi:hypothetical protein